MQKTIWVKSRLHEQREFPKSTLWLNLKKGISIEQLKWDRKTEKTTIYKRYILKKFKWNQTKKDKKHEFLTLLFLKEDLKKSKKKKLKLIEQILAKQYPTLSISFFNNLLSSTTTKINFNEVCAKKFVKEINKALAKNAKKTYLKEGK